MKTAGRRRLLTGVLTAVLLVSIPVIRAGATSDTKEKLEKAKQEKQATEEQKNATETNIDIWKKRRPAWQENWPGLLRS